jgi:uncharacterized protein (DUF58 family)
VQERGGKPRPGLCIVDAGCIDLAADGDAQMRLRRVARQRGPLTLGSVEIETRYPLGLFRAWTRVSLSASVLVYPAPAAYAPSPGLAAVSERRGSGDLGRGAEDFVGPRAYQPGDSPRRVDWKALARERGLVVKQFGGDRSARVLIDWDEVRAADDESRLSLLARQILDAHERGCGYGLRLPGLEIKQDRGEPHKHRCLAALARYPDHV